MPGILINVSKRTLIGVSNHLWGIKYNVQYLMLNVYSTIKKNSRVLKKSVKSVSKRFFLIFI